MAGQDFDPSEQVPELKQTVAPGQATDVSQQSGLRKAWDSWTSRPENNAALINFGLNLMQPRYPGETGLGHFASAVGAGAEASQRNVAEQRQVAQEEAAQEQKERALDIKEKEAEAYGELARQRGAGGAGMQEKLASQIAWKKWLDFQTGEESLTGTHPVVAALAKQNPAWAKYKTKAEVMADPAAREAAKNMILRQTIEDARTFGGTAQGGRPPPPGATIRYNNQGNAVWLDTSNPKNPQWIPAS